MSGDGQRLDRFSHGPAACRSRTPLALEGGCVATALRRMRAAVDREGMEQAPGVDPELERSDERLKAAGTKPATMAGIKQRL